MTRAGVVVAHCPGMSYVVRSFRWMAAVGIGVILAAQPGAATAPTRSHFDSRVEKAVKRGGAETTRVIIRVKPSSRRNLRTFLLAGKDFRIRREHGLISALTVDVPNKLIPVVAA